MAENLPDITQVFKGDASNLLREEKKIEGAYDDLGKKSKETSDGIGKDTKDSEKAFSEFDRLLRSKLKDDETALQGVQREFAAARAKVVDLRTELQRSSGSESLGFFQDLKAAEADLKGLENIGEEIMPGFRKSMRNAGHQGGQDLAKETEQGFADGFSGLPIRGAIIGGLVAASPLIVAMLGSAVAAGIGTAGVVAGVVGAAHDPRVRGAFGELGHEAEAIFSDATSVFIGPVLDAVHDLENMFAEWSPHLKAIFDTLANVARPLIDGFGGFIVQMLPGLEEGLKAALPLFEDLAKDLPWLGAQFGYMFKQIMSGGAGGRLALQSLIGVIGGVAVGIGNVINWSERMFLGFEEGLRDVVGLAAATARTLGDAGQMLHIPGSGGLDKLAGKLMGVHDRLDANIAAMQQGSSAANGTAVANENLANSVSGLGSSLVITAADMDALVKAQDDWIGKTQSLDDSLLSMHQAQTSFDKELKTGARNWDLNRAAGQAQQANLNSYNESITRYYGNLVALHPLNAQYVKDELAAVQALYDKAKAAGATTENLSGMADELRLLHQRLDELNHTNVSFTVTGHIVGVSPSKAGIRAFAEGGVVHADQGLVAGVLPPRDPGTLMVLAGERRTGGEIFAPLAGISQQRAMGLGQTLGDAYNFDVVPKVPRGYAYAGGGGVQTIVVPVHIGGKHMATVHQALIQPAQRYKARTGTTGLS